MCIRVILPTGLNVWRIKYTIHRKQKTYTIGRYPQISLSNARQQRDALKQKVYEGIDISEQKQLSKNLLQENTFQGIAEAWLTEKEKEWSAGTYERVSRYLRKDVYPPLGDKLMDNISIPDIIAIVKVIESRGAINAANRVKGFIQQVFDYAVVNCKASRNTARDINIQLILPKRTKKHFAAITDPKLLGELL
jgi:hypothetical protein